MRGEMQTSRGSRLGAFAAAWAKERWIAVGGWTMRYREAGSGPVIVLLHGLAVSADYWWRNGPPLAAAGFRVIAPDLPGFGRTRGPDGGLSIQEQAAAFNQWKMTMRLERSIHVGHSLSCQSLLQHALWFPEQVAGLVLAAPTGDPAPLRMVRQVIGLGRDAFRESWRLKVTVAQAYLRAGPVRTARTWRAAARHDALAAAEAVRCPGTVILGTRDPVVRRGFAEALARRLGGEVVWVPDGPHAVIFDTAEAFNSAVEGFARQIFGSTR